MNFAFTPEQEALRAEARRFLGERVNVRAQIDLPGAHDPALWKELVALGWLDEMPLVEQCILFEEAGRALLPGPFLHHRIAVHAISQCAGVEQKQTWLSALNAGEAVATIAPWRTTEGPQAEPGVTCADIADVFVSGIDSSMRIAKRSEVECVPLTSADLTRPRARVEEKVFEEMPEPNIANVGVRAAIAIAAESTGVAQRALDDAVAYAKDRVQFGRPIGSFQAIKHKAADVLRAVEAARLATYAAACDEGDAVAASVAKVLSNDAVLRATKENIQIHGGIGVTWEHDAHLLYRRALANSVSFGETERNVDRVARAMLSEVEV